MSRIIATYDVLNQQQEVVRQIEVEVDAISGWEDEAYLKAIDGLTVGESIEFKTSRTVAAEATTPPPSPELAAAAASEEPSKDTPPAEATPAPPSESVFTFDFEILLDGKVTKTVSRSAQAVEEGTALEAAVAVVTQELTEGESYRYTNRFTKAAIKQ